MTHKFNGVDIRTPTSFSWDMKDVETPESGMTLDGKTHSDILAQKRSLSYSWKDPTKEEVAQYLQLVNQNRYIDVTYPDAMSGTYETREFKLVKRDAPFRDLRVGSLLYSVLSFDFEER